MSPHTAWSAYAFSQGVSVNASWTAPNEAVAKNEAVGCVRPCTSGCGCGPQVTFTTNTRTVATPADDAAPPQTKNATAAATSHAIPRTIAPRINS